MYVKIVYEVTLPMHYCPFQLQLESISPPSVCFIDFQLALSHFHVLFQILYLTEPDSWSAAAMYQATRIFASNLNAKMAQR